MSVESYFCYRGELLDRLQRAYPMACPGLVEDAVDHAFLVLVAQPYRVDDALRVGGPRRVTGLLHVIGKRHLRDGFRKASSRSEISVDSYDTIAPATGASMDDALHLMRLVMRLIAPAARQFGHRRVPALEQALVARLLEGVNDQEAAEAFNVPRSYVNRARRWIASKVTESAAA